MEHKDSNQPAATERKHVLGKMAAKAAAGTGIPAALYSAVGTWGVASTGTAIASLNGAAATSATLAAIGGTVATGGAILLGVGVVSAVVAGLGYKKVLSKRRSKLKSE